MEGISDYITIFTQMPMAVILLFYIYKSNVNHQEFIKEVLKIIKRGKE